jgi:hypothetical protein
LATDSDRYDERIDRSLLPLRDAYDREVAALVNQIRETLIEMVKNFEPIALNSDDPKISVYYQLNKELNDYRILTNTIVHSCEEFLTHIKGEGVIPNALERLWQRIQNNQLPPLWLSASYDTARTNLAHYITEYSRKVDYWNAMIAEKFSSNCFMVSAFFDFRQLLIAKLQEYARAKKLSVRKLVNKFEVTQLMDPEAAKTQFKNELMTNDVTLLYGLHLEGAEWNVSEQLLQEPRGYAMQQPFPVIALSQV